MKKTVKIISVIAILAMLLTQLASCGRVFSEISDIFEEEKPKCDHTDADNDMLCDKCGARKVQLNFNNNNNSTKPPMGPSGEVTDKEDDIESPSTNDVIPYSIQVDNSEVFSGPLLLLNENYPYNRPEEDLISRNEMGKLSYSQLLSKYGFISLYESRDENFYIRDRLFFLDKDAGEALREMMADYVAETGIKNIHVRNAYYYDKSENIASTPDVNESLLNPHVMGTAIDLEIRHITDSGEIKVYPLRTAYHLYNTPQYYDWFVSNCHKYGFIHTGDTSSYSSFRYVGVPYAIVVRNSGTTLNSFIENMYLHDIDNMLTVFDENESEHQWWIYYVEASDGETTDIPVFGNKYTISGDNMGGFIVAVDTDGI